MRSRWIIVGLAVSVALNLFLLGTGAGVIALGLRMARDNPGLKPGALMVATAGLPQGTRHGVREMLRQERTEIEPQVDQSRAVRVQAWSQLAADKPDAAAIKAQLVESRQIDIGVRTKVEEKLVDYAMGMTPADRIAFAAGMRRVLSPPATAGAQKPAQ